MKDGTKHLRFHLVPTSASSDLMHCFLEIHYVTMYALNKSPIKPQSLHDLSSGTSPFPRMKGGLLFEPEVLSCSKAQASLVQTRGLFLVVGHRHSDGLRSNCLRASSKIPRKRMFS